MNYVSLYLLIGLFVAFILVLVSFKWGHHLPLRERLLIDNLRHNNGALAVFVITQAMMWPLIVLALLFLLTQIKVKYKKVPVDENFKRVTFNLTEDDDENRS